MTNDDLWFVPEPMSVDDDPTTCAVRLEFLDSHIYMEVHHEYPLGTVGYLANPGRDGWIKGQNPVRLITRINNVVWEVKALESVL